MSRSKNWLKTLQKANQQTAHLSPQTATIMSRLARDYSRSSKPLPCFPENWYAFYL